MNRSSPSLDAPRLPGGNAAVTGDDDLYLARLASRVRSAGLAPAAVLWLDSLRPLSFLGAQALHVAAPLMDVLVPDGGTSRLATLMENRAALDRFLSHLETPEAAARPDGRP